MTVSRTLKIKEHTVLLDISDYVRLCSYKWKVRTSKDGGIYFCVNKTLKHNGVKKRYTIYLHRAIMCPPYGLDLLKKEEVHHKNGYFDMRKESLEILTRAEHNGITHGNQ